MAVFVVGVALAAGSVILVQLLHTHLVDSSRSIAKARANTVALLVSGNPDVNDASLAFLGDNDDEFVQVLGSNGQVVAASRNMVGQPPVRTSHGHDVVSVAFDNNSFTAAHKRLTTRLGPRTVVTGSSLDAASDATQSLTGLLLFGYPIMVLIVGAMTWIVVGRTLAPVDRIRHEADEISASQLHRRLPEPTRNDEIGRLTRTMNLMLARLDHAQQQQRRFVSDAAHELRSPIASIKQNLEVATTYPGQLSTEELIETVSAESTRLERLVAALLSLAHLDERSPVPSETAVDIDDLVFAEADRLRRTTSLRIDTTAVSAGRVAGDEALLGQALRNLVDNAERHANATLMLTLSEHDTTVILSVEDDGPGIPTADRDLVFERFVRLDEARTRDDGGSGLGLAIVHEIITAHAGTVAVTSSPLGGARVLVTLPRLDEPL